MNVLITGGCGFVGSAIANRLIRERHQVTVLDDLSTGDRGRIHGRHAFFEADVADARCRRLFEDNRYEVVIHCANSTAYATGSDFTRRNATNTLGLQNMLEFSLQSGVAQFLFLSSHRVYAPGDEAVTEEAPTDPVDAVGKSYLMRESYCREYAEQGLNVSVLRLGKLYGPGMNTERDDLLPRLFENLRNGVQSRVDRDVPFDLLHIDDAAFAVYRATQNVVPAVLNISSGTMTKASRIVRLAEHVLSQRSLQPGGTSVISLAKRPALLDNRRAVSALDWVPRHPLPEGLGATLSWALSEPRLSGATDRARQEKSRDGRPRPRVLPLFENLVIFLIFAALQLLFSDTLHIAIDLMVVYAVLMGLTYGLGQGTIAAALAALHLAGRGILDGALLASLLLDLDFVFRAALYVLLGASTGYVVDKRRYEQNVIERECRSVREDLTFLEGVHEKSIQIKDRLQYEIENYHDSYGKVFRITDRLNTLSAEAVHAEAVQIISQIMKAPDVRILVPTPDGRFTRLMASTCPNCKIANSMRVEDHDFLLRPLQEQKTYVNREQDEQAPMVAAPVIQGAEVVAVVVIDRVAFEYLTLHFLNTLRMVLLITGNALARAKEHALATVEQTYHPGTRLMRAEPFERLIGILEKASAEHTKKMTLLALDLDRDGAIARWDEIAASIRETDYAGVHADGSVSILLNNTQGEDAKVVRSRLARIGVFVRKETE